MMVFERRIFRDKAGNTLTEDAKGFLGVRNREGKLVEESEVKKFIKRAPVKRALAKEGFKVKKVLSRKQTKRRGLL